MRNAGDGVYAERKLGEAEGEYLILEGGISHEAAVKKLYAAAAYGSPSGRFRKGPSALFTDAAQVFPCQITYGVSTPSIFWRAEVNEDGPRVREKTKKESHYFSLFYHFDNCHVVDVLHKNVH